MAVKEENPQPIRRSIRVECPIEDAFRLFTEHFSEWWPLALYSLKEEEAETCTIQPWVDGRLFERTRTGKERDWGTIMVWEPVERIVFAWHPGAAFSERQTVEIQFRVDAVGTEVILTHYGWEAAGIASAQRLNDLNVVAAHFSRFVCEQMMAFV